MKTILEFINKNKVINQKRYPVYDLGSSYEGAYVIIDTKEDLKELNKYHPCLLRPVNTGEYDSYKNLKDNIGKRRFGIRPKQLLFNKDIQFSDIDSPFAKKHAGDIDKMEPVGYIDNLADVTYEYWKEHGWITRDI